MEPDRTECINSSFIHDWRLVTLTFGIPQLETRKTVWYCTRCRKHERYEDKFGE